MNEFIESGKLMLLKQRGYGLYTIDDRVVVDKICRFENLNEEINSVCEHLSIPGKLELPRTKSKSRKDKKNSRDILSQQEQMKIIKLFQKEIDLLGYTF